MISKDFNPHAESAHQGGSENASKAKPQYVIIDGQVFDISTGRYTPLEKLRMWRADPTSSDFCIESIDYAMIDGDFDLALSLAEKALRKNTADLSALINKGIALAKQGNSKTASEINDQALAMAPNDSAALNNKALDVAKSGDYEAALSFMERSIAADPDYIPAYAAKAEMLMQVGRYEEADTTFEQGLNMNTFGALTSYQHEFIAESMGCQSVLEAREVINRRRADRKTEQEPQP